MRPLDAIRSYLVDRSEGWFSKADTLEVESLLSSCWDHLAGSRDGGMTAERLNGRTQGLEWNPPKLTFNIEEHTGVGDTPTTATAQHWEVDLDQGTAALLEAQGCQTIPMNLFVDPMSIAAELASAINEQREDPRIERVSMNQVTILIGQAIPATKGMTTTRRRNWFISEIAPLLQTLGWRMIGRNPLSFERRSTEFSKADDPDLNLPPVSKESSGPKVVDLRRHRRLSTPFPSHVGGLLESSSTLGSRPMDARMVCTPATPCGRLTCEGCSDPRRLLWISKTLEIAKSFPGRHEIATVFLGMLPPDLGLSLIELGRGSLRRRLKVANIAGPLLRGGIDVTWASAPDQWMVYAHALAMGVPPEAWARLRGIIRMTQPSYFNPDLMKVQRLDNPERQIPNLVKFHKYFWPRSCTGPARAVPLPADRLKELTDWGSDHSFKELTFEVKQKQD